MDTKKIQEILNEDRVEANKKIFDAATLPPKTIHFLKKALFHRSDSNTPFPAKYLKELIKKPLNEFTFLDVGTMLNLIRETPRYALYNTIEEALDYEEKFKDIVVQYNIIAGEIEKTIAQKERLLVSDQPVNGRPGLISV